MNPNLTNLLDTYAMTCMLYAEAVQASTGHSTHSHCVVDLGTDEIYKAHLAMTKARSALTAGIGQLQHSAAV